MKATLDGTTVLNIEYSDKEIKPHFCRETREMEFDCYLDGRYVGTASSHGEAAAKLDELVYDALTHQTNACGGFGCGDCVQRSN